MDLFSTSLMKRLHFHFGYFFHRVRIHNDGVSYELVAIWLFCWTTSPQ